MIAGLVVVVVLVLLAFIILFRSVALIPQAEAAVIERLGRYTKTVSGQLTLLTFSVYIPQDQCSIDPS